MTDIQLYTKITELPPNLKSEVLSFIENLKFKTSPKNKIKNPRQAGKARGLIEMKDNFDDPVAGFKNYMQ